MFGRGNWAIVGLAKESLEALRTSLEHHALMVACSQVAASAIVRQFGSDALGINPYDGPRLDEEPAINAELQAELAQYAIKEQEEDASSSIPAGIVDCGGYGFTAGRFQLHPMLPWYGMWFVSNEWQKTSDLASIKEQRSYVLLERPYRFLQSTDKKTIDHDTLGATTLVRKHVPVLLDFNEGRIYIENTNKKLIYMILVRLRLLGAEVIPVAWSFGQPNWIEDILNRLYDRTQHGDEFVKRAEEAKRFKPNEIEKLEDRELEAIVSSYFSMTQLPGDLWAGISGPAQIRLHDTAPAISVRPATSATTLLHMTSHAQLVTGALTFQERVSVTTKDGTESTFRKDLLRITLNDRINLTEVGAAMLRGFDLPMLRKDIQYEIRKTKQVPALKEFWGNWLHELNNAVRTIEGAFREILDLDGTQQAGVVPVQGSAIEASEELVTA